jgi:hypothetical protein
VSQEAAAYLKEYFDVEKELLQEAGLSREVAGEAMGLLSSLKEWIPRGKTTSGEAEAAAEETTATIRDAAKEGTRGLSRAAKEGGEVGAEAVKLGAHYWYIVAIILVLVVILGTIVGP